MIVPSSQDLPEEGQELQQEELQDEFGMGAHDQAARYASGNPAEQVGKDWDLSRQLDIPYSPDFERAALEEEARYRKMVQEMQTPSVWDHVPTNKWLQAPENMALSQNELLAMAGVGSARDRALAADKARVDLANRAGRVNAWLSPIVSLGRGAVELASLPGDILHLFDNFQRKMVGLPGQVAPKDTLSGAKEYLKSKEIATADLFVSDPVTGESFFNPDAISISNAAKLLAGEAPSMAAMVGLTTLTGGAGAPAAAAKYSPWLSKAYNLGKYMLKPAAVINSMRVAQNVYEGGIDYLMGKGQTREQAEANAAPGAILAGVGSTFLGSPMEARIIESWASSMAKQPATATLGRRVLTMLKQFPIQGTKEAAQEVLEGIGEDTAKWLTFQPDLTIRQAAQNMVGNALGGLVVGGAFGAALHSPIALQVGARTQYFEKLRARIQNSKMPEDKLIESIKVQAEGGPELPTVDARVLGTLWQGMGEDANQKAADLEIEGFLPALASGQEVQLSPKAFVQMAKDGTLDAIQEDLRLSPGAATAREDALYQKDAERIKKQVSEGKAPDEAKDPEFEEVKEFYRSRLIAAGRPVDVAETESLLAAAALTNVTRREGLSPKWALETYMPEITRPSLGEQGALIDRAMGRLKPQETTEETTEVEPETPEGMGWWETLFQRGGGRYSSAKEKLAARMRKLAASRPQALLKAMEESFREDAEAFAAFEEQIKPVQAGDILAGEGTRKGKKKGAGAGEPLGFFQYLDYGDGKKVQLGFLEKADLTTFLHEHTHFVMRIMRDLAARPEASEQIKADWQALKDLAGAKADKLTTKQEEKLAEAGEKYLMEGKAPSEGLRSAFQRVKRWFQLIYEVLGRSLNVKLSNDVRAVFDRIYATDQEIEEARGMVGDRPLLTTPESTGMTPEAHKRYLKIAQQEIDDANEKLDRAKLREVTKERRDFLEAERERIRPQVEALVDQEPVYRAIDALSDGELPNGQKIKLYKPALVEKYGPDATKDLPRSVKFGYKIAVEGSVDADGAAELLGYSNGQALLDALRMAEPKEAYINRLVDERVKALHGDPMDPAALAEAAQDAIHSSQPERMLIEARELRRAQRMAAPAVKLAEQEGRENVRAEREAGQAEVQREKTRRQAEDFYLKGVAAEVPPMRTFQEAAKEILAGARLIDIDPNKYLQAQRKFSGEAFRALANKDYETAADAKEKELLNHFLYREAKKWKEFQGKAEDYVRKLMSPAAQKRIAKAGGDQGERVYLASIQEILNKFGWGKESARFIDWKNDVYGEFTDFLAVEIARGNLPELDPIIFQPEKNYREMTGPELQAVYDSLKVIEKAAQREGKVIAEGKEVAKEEALAELADSAYGQFKIKPFVRDKATKSKIDRAVAFVKKLDAGMLKFEQWVDRLDGGDINGPWRRYIFEPAAMAQYEEYRLTHEITGRLAEAMADMPKEVLKNLDDKIEIPGLGTVTRRWIISAFANTGNQSNYQKLLKGEGLADFGGPELLGKAFDQMTKPEILFVQKLWDLLETLKPEIEALALRFDGIAPKWVEVRPFTVTLQDGEVLKLRGGYWPVMYDPEESLAGKRQEDAVFDEAKRQVFWPTTFTGYTKKRVEDFSRRMILDFETVLGRHLPKVIKDLSHREAVTSIARLLGNEGLQTTLNETVGVEYAKEFWPWLLNLVNDNAGVNSPSARTFEWVLNGLRTNLVAGTLGFRASSVAVQATDFARVMVGDHAVSPMLMGKSLSKFMGEFAQYAVTGGKAGFPMLEVMREKSPEMRGRAENLDRDIRASLKRLTLQEGNIARMQRWGFKGLAIADAVTSTVTWWAAFDQAITKGADTKQAVKEADRVVRLKLMTGAPKDQVALQANGSQLVKFMTMFMGDAVNTYGIARTAFENIADRKKLASSVFALAVVGFVAPILADIIKNKVPEDDEEKRRYVAGKLIFGLPQSLPFIRDVAGALEDGYTYKYTPVQTSIEKAIKAAKMGRDMLGDEKDVEWDDFAMAGLEAGGYLLGVPGAGQIATPYRYLENLEQGRIDRPESDAQHIRNLLFGPPPKPKGGR